MVLSRRRAAAVAAAIAACFCGASARPKHAEAMYGEASDESGGGGATGGERDEGGEGGEGGPALLVTPSGGCRAEPPPCDPP